MSLLEKMRKASPKQVFKTALPVFKLIVCLLPLVTAASPQDGSEETIAVLVGEDAIINCHIPYENILPNFETPYVIWKWKTENGSEWFPLVSQYDHESDNNTEGTKFVISTTVVQDATLNHSGVYACFLQGSQSILDQTRLLVGYSPDVPDLTYCQTNGVLTIMTCFWNPGNQTFLPTDYTLHLSVKIGKDFDNTTLRAFDNHVTIDVALKYSFDHYLQVSASNMLGIALTNTWSLKPSHEVKTDPPVGLSIRDLDDNTTCGLMLTWKPPFVNSMMKLSYVARHRKTNWDIQWKEDEVKKTSFLLTNLVPFTSYDIQLCAKPVSSALHDGYPSEWTESTSYRTALQAPSEPFSFKFIAAIKSPSSFSYGWKVIANWRVYSGTDQPGFYYDISLTISGKTEKWKLFQNNLTKFTGGSGRMEISGKYCNDMGCSPADKEAVDLDQVLAPVENVALSLETEEATVSWDLSGSALSNGPCVVKMCSTARNCDSVLPLANEDSTDVSSQICKSEMDLSVACTDRSINFNFTASPCRNYKAVIHRLLETGIHKIMSTSLPSATHSVEPSMSNTKHLVAQDTSMSGNYRIKVEWEWSESLCASFRDQLLDFSVIYAPISGAECFERKACETLEPFSEKISNCSKHITSHEISTNLYGATQYNITLGLCCKCLSSTAGMCFPIVPIPDSAITPPGAPSIPLNIKFSPSNPLKVHWTTPEHRNGNLDGYFLQYTNMSSNQTEEITSFGLECELPLRCSSTAENTSFSVWLSAYNEIDGIRTYSPILKEEIALCNYINPNAIIEDPNHGYFTGLVVGVCCCCAFILFALSVGYCYRKRLKQSIRKYIWPSIPVPNILVQFSDGVDKNGKLYKNAYAGDETYLKRDFDDNSKENEEESCQELPDSLQIFDNNSDEVCMAKEISSVPQKEFSLSIGIPKCDKRAKEDGSINNALAEKTAYFVKYGHSPYTEISPSSTFKTDCYRKGHLVVDSCQSTASWRSDLYPSVLDSPQTRRNKRPHSYAGSSGNSFNEADYVKNCSGFKERIDCGLRSLPKRDVTARVNYAKLKHDLCDEYLTEKSDSSSSCHNHTRYPDIHASPKIASCSLAMSKLNNNEKISAISNPERKLRVHSWYGGPASKSFAESTSDFQQSPADSNTSPYVVLPPECGTFQIQGTTTDHTNDDWEIPKRSRIDSKGCVADTSSSSLDHFYLSNLPWNSNQQSTSWNQEVPSQLPLLECYSPPPVIDKESYITMNDALSSSDRLGSVGSEDQYYEKSTSEKHLHRSLFTFDLKDFRSQPAAGSDEASYVFQASKEPYRNIDHAVSAYVTTEEAQVIGQN